MAHPVWLHDELESEEVIRLDENGKPRPRASGWNRRQWVTRDLAIGPASPLDDTLGDHRSDKSRR